MLPIDRFLADRICRRLGRLVELVVGRSVDQFEAGEVGFGVICATHISYRGSLSHPRMTGSGRTDRG